MKRRLVFVFWQLVLVLAVTVVAVLLAEQVARRKYPDLRYAAERQQRPEGLFIRFDPRLGWANVPSRTVRFERVDFDTQVTINSQGLRGEEVAREKPPGVERIAVLGDSYVFGHGVEDHEAFPARLDQRSSGVQALNFGVIGYSTDQELLLLRERVFGFEPDVVVLGVYRNDVLDNGKATAWGLYAKPSFELDAAGQPRLRSEAVAKQVPLGMRIRRELRQRFVLYDILAHRFASWAARTGEDPGTGEASSAAIELTRALLQEFLRECAERDVEVVLLEVAELEPRSFLDDLITDPSTQTVLDPSEAFETFTAAHPESSLTFEYDTHWNPTAHRLVAEELARLLQDKGWVSFVGEPDVEPEVERAVEDVGERTVGPGRGRESGPESGPGRRPDSGPERESADEEEPR